MFLFSPFSNPSFVPNLILFSTPFHSLDGYPFSLIYLKYLLVFSSLYKCNICAKEKKKKKEKETIGLTYKDHSVDSFDHFILSLKPI